MSESKRVSLRLIAQQATDGWVVEIVKNGIIVQHDVPIRDPLSPDQRLTCRWYLEQYVEYLPFSVDRAKEAELLLDSYPEDLLRQLPLREILTSDFENAASNLDSVLLSIEVCHGSDQGGCSVDTIHRLFWELLEDPELWCHPRLAVVVERTVSSSDSDRPLETNRLDCWKHPDGTLTLNILVVVARKITQSASMNDDISPFVTTDVLLKVKKMLANSRSPIHINVEIVRPGTLKSLVEHLERARTIHGKHGYFHVVHFDMHGKIGTRAGKLNKYGFLSFSDPTKDGTTSVPGRSVAKALEKFKIPFVVLNACESARACLGDDANVAQQFLKHGVRSVLGMSFKVAASAAAVFLEAFYHALLVRGGSFSEAAAMGRRMLRMNPIRPGRYNRQLQRQDSFVAVTYGPGLDCVLAQSTYPWQEPFTHHTILLPATCSEYLPTPLIEEMYGRDFDILKLEKRLLQTNSVYLYGLAGVGKSVFLDRAASLWRATKFVDAVVAIDFSKNLIWSGEEVSLAILHQLLSQVDVPHHQSRLWIMPSRSLQSYNHVMVGTIVGEILSEIESILIFDSLDIPLMGHPSHLAPAPSTSSVAGLCQLMNLLAALSLNSNKKTRLVFAGRRGHAQWLEKLIGLQFQPLLLELEGLNLPSALDLSHQVLQACGEDTHKWSYEDADHLVAIVQLLACNPSALLDILPLQRALKIEWRLFYRRLHQGLFVSVADLEQVGFGASHFSQEIRHASVNLRQGHFFFICRYTLYWDETVSVDMLQSIFNETANASLRQDFHIPGTSELSDRFTLVLLSFMLDRGYLRLSNDEACLHVHPLLTIVGRAYLFDFIRPAARSNLRAVFCSSLESLNSLFIQQKLEIRIGIANIFSVADFCLTDVPSKNWPLSLLTALNEPNLAETLPRTTYSIAEDQIFQLLKLLSTRFDEVEPKERYISFFILVLLRFISSLENSSQTWIRASELSSIGLRLLLSLNQQHLAVTIQTYQSCLLLVQLLCSFALKDDAGRQRNWQALMPLKDELYEELSQKGQSLPDLKRLDMSPAGIDGIFKIIKDIQDSQNPNVGLSDLCNFILAIAMHWIEANKAEIISANTSREEKLPKRTTISEQQEPELSPDIDTVQFKRMLGFDERSLHSIPTVDTESGTDRNKTHKSLEDSHDTGNWTESLKLHQRMIIEASNGHRFNEAEQHLESMRAILTKVSAPRELFDALEDMRKAIHKEYQNFMVSCSLYSSTSEARGHTSEGSPPQSMDASGEPESSYKSQLPRLTHQDLQNIKQAIKECVESPRKWWESWESSLDQDSGWIAQVYNDSVRYKEETRLMNEVHGACIAKDMKTALSLTQKLDALCKDSIFADYEMYPSTLGRVRNYFETALRQFEILHDWQAALARDDFKKGKALLNNLSASIQLESTSLTPRYVEALYVATEREILIEFTKQFYLAAKAKELSSCQKLYCGFLELVNTGELSRIRLEEIMSIRSEALGMLMEQTMDAKKWQDGISYCDEYLVLCTDLRKCDLEARNSCIQVKSSCKWGLAKEQLAAAETNLDVKRCLKLVDAMQKLYETQMETPGRIRSRFVFLGPKHVEFLKGSYRDRCFSCASWSRQRVPGDCRFQRGRGPNHDRSIFKVPFGCCHHCVGGYCWYM